MIKTPKGSCFRGLFYYYHFNQALAEEFPADAGLVGILGSLKPVFFPASSTPPSKLCPRNIAEIAIFRGLKASKSKAIPHPRNNIFSQNNRFLNRRADIFTLAQFLIFIYIDQNSCHVKRLNSWWIDLERTTCFSSLEHTRDWKNASAFYYSQERLSQC
jgi:hypothetical protein